MQRRSDLGKELSDLHERDQAAINDQKKVGAVASDLIEKETGVVSVRPKGPGGSKGVRLAPTPTIRRRLERIRDAAGSTAPDATDEQRRLAGRATDDQKVAAEKARGLISEIDEINERRKQIAERRAQVKDDYGKTLKQIQDRAKTGGTPPTQYSGGGSNSPKGGPPSGSSPDVKTGSPPGKGGAAGSMDLGKGVPKQGTLKSGSVTLDYDVKGAQPKVNMKVSDIDMSEYPPERKGPITGHFGGGSRLQTITNGANLTRLLASLAAEASDEDTKKKIEYVTQPIQSYFRGKLEDARKELRAKFPEPRDLWRASGLEKQRKAYDAAAAKLRAPENLRVAAAVLIALSKEKDREEAFRRFGPKLQRVGINPDDLKAFEEIGIAYENAMADLRQQLWDNGHLLPDIAADIGKRASFLLKAGQDLEDTFWRIIQSPLGLIPLVYYEALGIYNVAGVFSDLGGRVSGFADEVEAQEAGYEQIGANLDEELIRVGNQLNDFYVPRPRERGSGK
jgi:hypothetical protein